MSHVVVTGARGFIGRVLVKRLLTDGLGGRRVDRLTAVDLAAAPEFGDARVHEVVGSLTDRAVRARACDAAVDAVFHLASVPGGQAERDYALGRAVNLDATVALLEALSRQAAPPRFIYASTVAVYGEPLPGVVDEATVPAPALTYGAHKLACEALVADASRRGWVEGSSLRLPGIVARPGDGAGLLSAFMSQLFWRLAAGEPIVIPVPAAGTAWWLSARACVTNLVHAAGLDPARLGARRSIQVPVLRLSIAEVVDALARRYGEERRALVSYAPEALAERLFARYPALSTPGALALGFRSDGDVEALVTAALEPLN